MKMNCPVCNGNSKFVDQINSYIHRGRYNIYQCSNCKLQFADGDKSKFNLIYDSIYKYSSKIRGYERYGRYYNEISSFTGRSAIDYLINEEETYKHVYHYLINQENCRRLRILEVGSGLGYFTYALSEDGFNILGIDLSEDAVKMSTNAFGSLYKSIDLKKLDEQFDIIILCEVIHHLIDPIFFLKNLKSKLNKGGKIILTTPRKYIEQSSAIWLTELPPVHLFWFTTLSLQKLGNRVGLDFGEIEVKQNGLIFDSKTSAKPMLDLNLMPIEINENVRRHKSVILSWTPLIIKRFYYKITKNVTISPTKSHSTIFSVYSLK